MAKHLVIMAGGIGSRFWPMSTPQCPKQFLDITDCGRTMLQQTLDRFDGLIDMSHVWVVTSADFHHLVEDQLSGIHPQHILLEPCMRNTAPCVAYVSWKIQKEDPEALMVVTPSDHLVMNIPVFQEVIRKGLDFVSEENRILTLGMKPTCPETGYGYIEQGEQIFQDEPSIYKIKTFREKPDLPTAIGYLKQGGFTWNAGIFLWSVNTIVAELRRNASQIAGIMDQIADYFFTKYEQTVLNELFPKCERISIDYAVMEKTQLAYVLPVEFGWSDLGTWGSLRTITLGTSRMVEDGNAVIGNQVTMIESSRNMVKVPNGKKVVIQGLHNCIVAEHNNTLLICQLSEEQRIKDWHK